MPVLAITSVSAVDGDTVTPLNIDDYAIDLDAEARGIRNGNETVYRLRMGNDGLGSTGPIVLKTLEDQRVRYGG